MKALEFKEQNTKVDENQEENNTLPAFIDTEKGTMTSCFKLDEDELKQVREDGVIYLTLFTGNRASQPIAKSFINPFKKEEG